MPGLFFLVGEPFEFTHHHRIARRSTVAATCDVCGKGPGFGNSISHSHRRTPRRWNPNIQTVRTLVGRTPKKLNVCTSCIKAGKVTRA
jgi:large subunit ribosomal protein L28